MFILLGLVLLIFANFIDTLDISLSLFRNRIGLLKWALEESCELLASAAFLFAVMSRMYETVHDHSASG
jgi:hypothetical protein